MDTAAALAQLTDLYDTADLTRFADFLRLVQQDAPAATVADVLVAVTTDLTARQTPADRPLVDPDFDEGWADFPWSTVPAA
jgi:hypothetical protein